MQKFNIKMVCVIILLVNVAPLDCMLRRAVTPLRPATSGMSREAAARLAAAQQKERLSAQTSGMLPVRDTSTWSGWFQSMGDRFKSLLQRSPVQPSDNFQQSNHSTVRTIPFGARGFSTTPVQRISWFQDRLQKLINPKYEEEKRIEERKHAFTEQLREMSNDIQDYHQISQVLEKIAEIEGFEAKNLQEKLDRFEDVPTAISWAIMDLYVKALPSAKTFADIKTLEEALKLKLRYTPALFVSGMKPDIDALKKKYQEIYENLEKEALKDIVMPNEEKLALESREDKASNTKLHMHYLKKMDQKRQEIQKQSEDSGIGELEELIKDKIKREQAVKEL